MSVFLFEKEYCLLEPCEGKLSRTVLRGESTRKGADLPDHDVIRFRLLLYCIFLSASRHAEYKSDTGSIDNMNTLFHFTFSFSFTFNHFSGLPL